MSRTHDTGLIGKRCSLSRVRCRTARRTTSPGYSRHRRLFRRAVAAVLAMSVAVISQATAATYAQTASPTVTVSDEGQVNWDYSLPEGSSFAYSEVRWAETAQERLNDWSNRSNRVFYSPQMKSFQIPGLTAGVHYKAKVFVGVRSQDGMQYLKSDTIRFSTPAPQQDPVVPPPVVSDPVPPPVAPEPTADPEITVADNGKVTWSHTLATSASFVYSEIRWRETSDEGLNDWSNRSSRVFYSPHVSEFQIPDLSEGKTYKTKVFVGVRIDGDMRYLKSQTLTFKTAAAPSPPAQVTLDRSDGALSVAWTPVDGASAYNIKCTDDRGDSWTCAQGVPAGGEATSMSQDHQPGNMEFAGLHGLRAGIQPAGRQRIHILRVRQSVLSCTAMVRRFGHAAGHTRRGHRPDRCPHGHGCHDDGVVDGAHRGIQLRRLLQH